MFIDSVHCVLKGTSVVRDVSKSRNLQTGIASSVMNHNCIR